MVYYWCLPKAHIFSSSHVLPPQLQFFCFVFSSEELLTLHEGGIDRDEENYLGVTLAVSDPLGLRLLECLCVQTQTVLIHFKREALMEERRGLWEQDKGEKRCRKEEP